MESTKLKPIAIKAVKVEAILKQNFDSDHNLISRSYVLRLENGMIQEVSEDFFHSLFQFQ